MIGHLHSLRHGADGWHVRHVGSPEQDDVDPEISGRPDLAGGRDASAVLGHDCIDAALVKQLQLVTLRKRTARQNVFGMRHVERRVDWIDAADQVAVLRRRGKRGDFLPPQRQEDTPRRWAECRDRFFGIGNEAPAVAGDQLPRRTPQGKRLHARKPRGLAGILRNFCRIGMCRVDQQVDGIIAKVARQPFGPAEAATTNRHGLRGGLGGAARERQGNVKIAARSEPSGQEPRFGGAAENENAVGHDVC